MRMSRYSQTSATSRSSKAGGSRRVRNRLVRVTKICGITRVSVHLYNERPIGLTARADIQQMQWFARRLITGALRARALAYRVD